MIQNIFIIGIGNVGTEVIKQITEHDTLDLGLHVNPTKIVGIANSTYFYFDHNGINFPANTEVTDALIKEILLNKGVPYDSHDQFIDVIQNHGLESDVIFIDVTCAREEVLNFHLNVMTGTDNKIVTANKNPLALSSFSDFRRLTIDRNRYGLRTTVMAGAQTVDAVGEFYDTCEKVKTIQACLSGTLGYICAGLEKGEKISSVIEDAHKKGYTEPNPLDDLSGEDVARKVLILARSLNIDLSMNDIKLKPFIDTTKYEQIPIKALFQQLKGEDENFSKLVNHAKSNNCVLRYVATIDLTSEPILKVELVPVKKESALGVLDGTANKVVIQTNHFTENQEYIIQAPGAGAVVTATGIRRDLLQMLHNRTCGTYSAKN